MKILPFALSALLGASLPADTQKAPAAKPAPDAKTQDIARLLAHLGWPQANSDTARKQLASAEKDPKLAAYPAAYWKEYREAASPATFEKLLVPIFDKAYSHAEIKALLKLLSSPEMKQVQEKHAEGLRLLLDKTPTMLKGQAYETFSAHMTEVGRTLAKKHGTQAPAGK